MKLLVAEQVSNQKRCGSWLVLRFVSLPFQKQRRHSFVGLNENNDDLNDLSSNRGSSGSGNSIPQNANRSFDNQDDVVSAVGLPQTTSTNTRVRDGGFTLGVLGGQKSIDGLLRLMGDSSTDVRSNAALGLARPWADRRV